MDSRKHTFWLSPSGHFYEVKKTYMTDKPDHIPWLYDVGLGWEPDEKPGEIQDSALARRYKEILRRLDVGTLDKEDADTELFDLILSSGYVRGGVVSEGRGYYVFLHYARKPSRQSAINTAWDVIQHYNLNVKAVNELVVDWGPLTHPFSHTYPGHGLFEQGSFMTLVLARLEESEFAKLPYSSLPTARFFIKPDWSVIKIHDPHWVWVQKYLHKLDHELDAKVGERTMEPMFREGWWRGSVYRVADGLSVELETYPFPSKQKVIDAVWSYMDAYGTPASAIAQAQVETEIGRHREQTYSHGELFDED